MQNKTNFIEALKWRYATKKFDKSKKVSSSDLNELLESARLAPSSFGLQPWKMVVVTNEDLRKKLSEKAWGQPQVTEASHLIVVCARTDLDEHYVDKFIEKNSEVRGTSVKDLEGFKEMLNGFVAGLDQKAKVDWSKRQSYIALGMLLSAAALKRIDACPMEGFSPEGFDEVLNLKKENLTSVAICAIGYRSPEDPTINQKKVRWDLKDLIVRK